MPPGDVTKRVALAAAYGGGLGAAGLSAAGVVSYALMKAEARLARKIVGVHFEGAPEDSDVYGGGLGPPIELLVLGDSLAAGMGTETRYQTIGGIIATGLAALTGGPVRLTNVAVIGAKSADLDEQVTRALAAVAAPRIAVVTIGGNDVTHRVSPSVAVAQLRAAVVRLRKAHCEVIVGTCPDLGTIEPLPQPLRGLARHWSRSLATAQTVAVVESGGRTVSLADLLGPEFISRPAELFSSDRFHPSPAGYARVAAALLPSVCAALGLWSGDLERRPDRHQHEGIRPVREAAHEAVHDPGTEVSATGPGSDGSGGRGRWAMFIHRRRPQGPPDVPEPAESGGSDQPTSVRPQIAPGGLTPHEDTIGARRDVPDSLMS